MHYWADLQSVHGLRCYDNIHACMLIALYTANAYSCAEREMSARAYSVYGWLLLLPDPVYTIQPVVKPVEQPVGQPVECLFTRCSRLFSRFDNWLYRVNGVWQ